MQPTYFRKMRAHQRNFIYARDRLPFYEALKWTLLRAQNKKNYFMTQTERGLLLQQEPLPRKTPSDLLDDLFLLELRY